ncbi:MAG: amidase domain-containing protein [bacterium]|nr:amidase domain-containing protein [bacterium]
MKNAIHFPNRHESSRLLLAAILQHAESTITLIVNRSMRIFLFVAWIVATSAYAGYHPCAAVRYANQYAQTPNQFYGSVPDPCLNPGRFVGDAANFMSQVLAAGCRIPCTDDNPPDHQGVEGCPDCQQSAAFTENGCLDPPARPNTQVTQTMTMASSGIIRTSTTNLLVAKRPKGLQARWDSAPIMTIVDARPNWSNVIRFPSATLLSSISNQQTTSPTMLTFAISQS